jgi:hypothetical protein
MSQRVAIIYRNREAYRGILCEVEGDLLSVGRTLLDRHPHFEQVKKLIEAGNARYCRDTGWFLPLHELEEAAWFDVEPVAEENLWDLVRRLPHDGHAYWYEAGRWCYNGKVLQMVVMLETAEKTESESDEN